jgi:formamidopyrimidine-DNA glycosylase
VPELLEVEAYRSLADATLDRRIRSVVTPDLWILKRDTTPARLRALVGARFVASRRRGKLLLLDTDLGPTLGLRFGMTGVLVLDGIDGVDQLEYASTRRDERWVRFAVEFDDGGTMSLRDPRRLGGVELDPDEDALGPDALTVSQAQLRDLLASSAPLKARLMDQRRIAGLGNLLTDEILWRASLDPNRPANSLTPAEQRRLHTHLRRSLDELMARGGSHTGDLHHARVRGSTCPRDGTPLDRRTIGGRTTYSCPTHQR